MTHTPGPWAVDRRYTKGEPYRGIIQESREFWIANLPAEHEYAEGDANLIAAAPELLAVLSDLMEDLPITINDATPLLYDRAKVIIAKAWGEDA
jgi:hypothetical protein